MTQSQTEFEDEFEEEYEDEEELEGEEEAFLGALSGIARSFPGESEDEYEAEAEEELEGEYEYELEQELEDESESEDEFEYEDEYEGEAFLGALGGIARSFLGDGESESEVEAEAEEFFKSAGRFFMRNRKLFTSIAKKVGPLVATAVGGPAAGALARAVASQLEGEFEAELEAELEEMANAPITQRQALGEYLAARAASTESEYEAEAFTGSAVTLAISQQERRQLDTMLPHVLRGAAILTRALHRNPSTRPGVRLVPGIVDAATRTLVNRSADRPIRRSDVGAVLGTTARRVLSDPRSQLAATRRHTRGVIQLRRGRQAAARRAQQYGRPATYLSPRSGYRGADSIAPRQTIRRNPVASRAVPKGARVGRPQSGLVRVVTPVRIPARGGAPARTVRVVSDVRVPRGAVPAGRPVGIAGRRR